MVCLKNSECTTGKVCSNQVCLEPSVPGSVCTTACGQPTDMEEETTLVCIKDKETDTLGRCRIVKEEESDPFTVSCTGVDGATYYREILSAKCKKDGDCASGDQYCDPISHECIKKGKYGETCPTNYRGSLSPCVSGLVCYKSKCQHLCNKLRPCGNSNDECYEISGTGRSVCVDRGTNSHFMVIGLSIGIIFALIVALILLFRLAGSSNKKSNGVGSVERIEKTPVDVPELEVQGSQHSDGQSESKV